MFLLLTHVNQSNLYSQEISFDNKQNGLRNNLNFYVGVWDFNVNYEHLLVAKPKSFTNIRLGLGTGLFWYPGNGGPYANFAIAQMLGKKVSFLEFDLGVKVLFLSLSTGKNPLGYLVPDIYAGYRYEDKNGKVFFRIGISYASLLSAGVGIKF